MAIASDGSAAANVTSLLTTKAGTLTVPAAASSFLKLNAGQFGFFRVLYPDAEWTKLTKALKTDPGAMAPVDRAGLLDDAFNLARAGKLPYDKALNALEYLDQEKDYIPWIIVSSGLTYITNNYGGEKVGKWRSFVAEKAGKALEAIQFQEQGSDSYSTKRLRPYLIDLACIHGDSKCLAQSKDEFTQWLDKPDNVSVNVNVRQQIYEFGMKNAGEKEWNDVHAIYKKTTIPQERNKLRYAMAAPNTPWILKRYIDYAKNEDQGFKSQDYFSIMETIADNPVGLPVVWEYLKSHWEDLVKRFTINDRYFGRMVMRIISNFNTEFHLKDVEAFFARYPEAGAGKRARAEGLANIRNNIAWREEHEKSLDSWLA